MTVTPDELTIRLMSATDEKNGVMSAAESAALDELTIYHAPSISVELGENASATSARAPAVQVSDVNADEDGADRDGADANSRSPHVMPDGQRCFCRHCLLLAEGHAEDTSVGIRNAGSSRREPRRESVSKKSPTPPSTTLSSLNLQRHRREGGGKGAADRLVQERLALWQGV